jgi:PadR family transcriptional regulator PadR
MNMKGSLPLLIMHNLSLEPSHGYRIAKQIRVQSDGVLDFKEGTLYPTLHNLEKQGLISSYKETENGRSRRYYQLTDSGKAALAQQREEWTLYAGAVNLILEGKAS